MGSSQSTQAIEQPTERQVRAMRRQYVTVAHGTVRACGHKIDVTKPPKINCDYCWEAYFKTVDNLLVTIHEELVTKGLPFLKAKHGIKLVKAFARFLDRELNQEQETNAVRTEEGESSNTEARSDSTGVGSGEIQGAVQAIGDSGQEAQYNEQLNAVGEAAELGNQDHQHESAELGQ